MEYRIQLLCREQGINLVQLAEKVGITQANISRIITGKGNPTVETLEKIASGLNVTIQELFSAPNSDLFGLVVYMGTTYRIDNTEGLKHLLDIVESVSKQ